MAACCSTRSSTRPPPSGPPARARPRCRRWPRPAPGRPRGARDGDGLPRRRPAAAAHRRRLARRRRQRRAGERAEPDGHRGARGVRHHRRAGRQRLAGDPHAGARRAPRPRDRHRAGVAARGPHRQRPPGCARQPGPGGGRGGRGACRSPPYAARRCSPAAPSRSSAPRSTGGEEALATVGLEVGRPVLPMLASSAPDLAAAMAKAGRRRSAVAVDVKLDGIRIQVHRTGDDVADRHPQPRRHHRAAARGGRGRPCAARPSGSCSTARPSRWTTPAGPDRSRRPRRAPPRRPGSS